MEYKMYIFVYFKNSTNTDGNFFFSLGNFKYYYEFDCWLGFGSLESEFEFDVGEGVEGFC